MDSQQDIQLRPIKWEFLNVFFFHHIKPAMSQKLPKKPNFYLLLLNPQGASHIGFPAFLLCLLLKHPVRGWVPKYGVHQPPSVRLGREEGCGLRVISVPRATCVILPTTYPVVPSQCRELRPCRQHEMQHKTQVLGRCLQRQAGHHQR